MCLCVPPDIQSSIAEEDIEVFKVLQSVKHNEYGENGLTLLVSPYQFYRYDVGKTHTSNVTLESVSIEDTYSYKIRSFVTSLYPEYTDENRIGMIEIGLHSIESYDDAQKLFNAKWWENPVIVRCVIPKGSQYYKGAWAFYSMHVGMINIVSYASDKLKVIEILK